MTGDGDGDEPEDSGSKGSSARFRKFEAAVNRRASLSARSPWLLVVAVVLFITISVVSFLSLPDGVHFHWWIVPIVVLVTTPLRVVENAAEFRVMSAINGHRTRWIPAVRLTIIATAANLLPLPGGVVIRTQALRQRGSTYRSALAANAAAMLAWIGMGAIGIGALIVANSSTRLFAVALVAFGIGCLAGVDAILRRVNRAAHRRYLAQLIAIEGITVIVGGISLFLAFRLIGLNASAPQAVALSASQIIAAAIGIFPSGLGLREVIAGGIAAAFNLRPYGAVAATVSDRITSQLGVALLAVIFIRLDRSSGEIDQPALTG